MTDIFHEDTIVAVLAVIRSS